METGLINLKAELSKKRAEAKLAASNNDANLHYQHQLFAKTQKGKPQKNSPLNVSKKKQSGRSKLIDHEALEEERRQIKKSKSILKEKAALYDKLKAGTKVLEDDELNDKFLVNFQKKIENEVVDRKKEIENEMPSRDQLQQQLEQLDPTAYEPQDDTEEWAEYVDSFGRTRTCLQKDLQTMRSRSQMETKAKIDVNSVDKAKMANLHRKWATEQDDADKKHAVHYQDLLFDEARAHGVAFMQFSRDEMERKAQQRELKKLRQETLKAELTKRDSDKSKKAKMVDRLAKVRQRKRLKMGLPCIDPTEEMLKTPPQSEEESDDNEIEANVEARVKKIQEERELQWKEKAEKLREWDVGKMTTEGSLLTQEQWVAQKRKERNEEFGPTAELTLRPRPSEMRELAVGEKGIIAAFVKAAGGSNTEGGGPYIGGGIQIVSDDTGEYYDQITPKDVYGNRTSSPTSSNKNLKKYGGDSGSKGMNDTDTKLPTIKKEEYSSVHPRIGGGVRILREDLSLRQSCSNFSPEPAEFDAKNPNFDAENPSFDAKNPNFNTENPNFEARNLNFDAKNPNFAPPPTYEYYGPSQKYPKSFTNRKGDSKNLEDAISKGLSNLRNKYS